MKAVEEVRKHLFLVMKNYEREKTMEENRIYNIVDSVKGGCGKTTFSIMLSLLADSMRTEPRDNDETNACLIDMDIQGTALTYLLFGKTMIEDVPYGFLNDCVVSMKEIVNSSWEGIRNFHFADYDKKKARFDVICSNPDPEEKKKFRARSTQNYSPAVMYSTFRMGLGNLLSSLKSQKPYLHKHIIFDMPPNSDGYSDAVYDVMLNEDYSVMKKDDICNLFLMQTMDSGQRYATMDYFRDLIVSVNSKKINKIFFVFNDWLDFNMYQKEENEDGLPGLFEEAIGYVKDICTECNLPSEDRKKIYFFALNFNWPYYKLCTQTDGIFNKKMPDFKSDDGTVIDSQAAFLKPIKFFASLEEPGIKHLEDYKNLFDLLENK